MKEVKIQFDTYKVPEGWEEAFDKLRLKDDSQGVATVLQLCLIGKETLDRNGMELLVKTMLDVPSEKWQNLQLSLDQWVWLCNEVDWVFKLPLLVRPFDSFRLKGKVYYVPDMERPTAIEIAKGLVYFTQLGKGDDEAADFLLPVFCREKDVKYSSGLEIKNAEIFKEMDPWKKSALVKYFTDCLAVFIEDNQEMFGEGGKPIYEHGEGWFYMLGNPVKTGYYASLDAVYEANAVEVWGWMKNDALEAARVAAQNK